LAPGVLLATAALFNEKLEFRKVRKQPILPEP